MNAPPLTPASNAPPAGPTGWRAAQVWARRELFGGPFSTLATLAIVALLAWALPPLWHWAVGNAVWSADLAACQSARGTGACWGVVAEKHRLILFGRYPFDQQWRAALATGLLLALVVISAWRRCWRPALGAAWAAGLALFFWLMAGGIGLTPVPTERWGGLPLTLMLATFAIATALPLGIALALGRRSSWPALRAVCTVYIETVRGVPLVSVLFMASFLFPLLLPAGRSPDVLLRVGAGMTLFAAAYLAETVRAGLQSLPTGQTDAARALGLRRWQIQRHILLPQALTAVVPALMNSFIGLLKDTSLVTIVSLYELSGALGLALNGDADWRPFIVEAYLFVIAIYFVLCLAMSRYSLRVEGWLGRGR